MKLSINGRTHTVPADWQEESLLDVLREALGLTGTKFGCGIGICGACTVHIDGTAARACMLPASALTDVEITTIEGLASDAGLHPVQQAWIDERVPQCGYCQPGQIMSAAALLAEQPDPSEAQIDAAMHGNLCRCGTYDRIRKGIHRAVSLAGWPTAGVADRPVEALTDDEASR